MLAFLLRSESSEFMNLRDSFYLVKDVETAFSAANLELKPDLVNQSKYTFNW